MGRRLFAPVDLPAIFVLGVICFLFVLLPLLPNFLANSSEARATVAYFEACQLQKAAAAEGYALGPLEEKDPWDQPYRLMEPSPGKLRVVSSGPNRSMLPAGVESDDIYSDMPTTPTQQRAAKKAPQAYFALAAFVLAWIATSSLYLWSVRPKQE